MKSSIPKTRVFSNLFGKKTTKTTRTTRTTKTTKTTM